jgi:hypothetical protein
MSPIVVRIAETKDGVSFSIEGEENPPARAAVKLMWDRVEPVLRQHYQPVRTFFKPIRKTKKP